MATVEDLEARVQALEAQQQVLERMLGSMLRTGGVEGSGPVEVRSDEFEPILLGQLTTKQHVALQCLLAGKSNAEIAERFGVTENGAKVYLRAIYKKFGVNTRSQAVMSVYDEWEKISDRRYMTLSKGVPKNWHVEYLGKPIEADPYRELYEVEKD